MEDKRAVICAPFRGTVSEGSTKAQCEECKGAIVCKKWMKRKADKNKWPLYCIAWIAKEAEKNPAFKPKFEFLERTKKEVTEAMRIKTVNILGKLAKGGAS